MKAKPDHSGGKLELFGVVILRCSKDRPWGVPVKRIEGNDRAKVQELAKEFIYLTKREPGVWYEVRPIAYW